MKVFLVSFVYVCFSIFGLIIICLWFHISYGIFH